MNEQPETLNVEGGAAVRCSALFGDWKPRPHDKLRAHPDGTMFLLRLHTGAIHLCELCGNLPEDESRKARRLSDCKIIRLENLQRAEFIVLSPNVPAQRPPANDA